MNVERKLTQTTYYLKKPKFIIIFFARHLSMPSYILYPKTLLMIAIIFS